MAQPLVNGQAYDFTQIVLIIGGVSVTGVSAINYITEQEKANNFGVGNWPASRGRGPRDASGSIELSMNEVEAIRDAAPNGDLTAIAPFDIKVYFGNIQNPVTHVLKNAEFMNDGVETSQGDTDIRRTFDLIISHIKYR